MSEEEAVAIYLESLELFEVKGFKIGLNKARELVYDAKGDRDVLLDLIDREIKRADRMLTDVETLRLVGSIERHLKLWYTDCEVETTVNNSSHVREG